MACSLLGNADMNQRGRLTPTDIDREWTARIRDHERVRRAFQEAYTAPSTPSEPRIE